jgi:hypothetical protein
MHAARKYRGRHQHVVRWCAGGSSQLHKVQYTDYRSEHSDLSTCTDRTPSKRSAFLKDDKGQSPRYEQFFHAQMAFTVNAVLVYAIPRAPWAGARENVTAALPPRRARSRRKDDNWLTCFILLPLSRAGRTKKTCRSISRSRRRRLVPRPRIAGAPRLTLLLAAMAIAASAASRLSAC